MSDQALAIFSLIATTLLGLYVAWSTHNKNKSDARKNESDIVTSIISAAEKTVHLREVDIDTLQENLRVAQLYIDYIFRGSILLLEQLRSNGIHPIFTPMSYDEFVRKVREQEDKNVRVK